MRTLDEVIKAWSICFSDNSRSDCTGCPYADEDGDAACFNHDREDALYYLKELRDMTDIPMEYFENGGTLQNFADTSQITCPKCHSEFVILPDANNALTWSELKQMEGKPVWVELPNSNRTAWGLNDGIYVDAFFHEIITIKVLHDLWHLDKEQIGVTWKAYRKEKTDAR